MKNKIAWTFCLLVMFSVLSLTSFGQPDTIRLNDKRLFTSALKPGLKQYLVYSQNPKKEKSLGFWYWLRKIEVENRGREKVFAITQHWFGSDSSTYRYIYSINKESDFAPLYHSEIVRNELKAYNWSKDKITGDSVYSNKQKGFKLDFDSPNFNWNLDIETFEMLPLAAGKIFVINFYDAGLEPPKYVVYKVIGSEKINTTDNHYVNCWKLFTEGEFPGGHFSETYWISKHSHEFLKEEDSINDTYRYKIKMPAATPDILVRFRQ